jgi:hypothetical protein
MMRVVKDNLNGNIPDMLRQKNNMMFMDYLARGLSKAITEEREANTMSNGAVNASVSINRIPQVIDRSIDRRPQVIDRSIDRRPQVIIQLERDLTTGLKDNDIRIGERGVYLFNLNQVAYIIEGDLTDGKKSAARERVSRILLQYNIYHVMVRVSGAGNFIV